VISLEKISKFVLTNIISTVVILVGIVLVLLSLIVKTDFSSPLVSISGNDVKTILISVGTSLIASAMLSFLSTVYLHEKEEAEMMVDYWGLTGIYFRRDKSKSSNPKIEVMNNQFDIIAFGVSGLRDAMSKKIEERVKRGVKVRMLTINPNSLFLRQRELNEKASPGSIRQTILNLDEWVKELKLLARNPNDVEIKYYNSLPLDLYFRVDKTIFVGPYLYGKQSQQTITYEYHSGGEAFNYYTDHFEELWKDTKFAKLNYNEFTDFLIENLPKTD